MSNTITGAKGITFEGDTFIVPQTHDMVKTLFDPTIRKSIFELTIVGILIANCGGIFLINDNDLRVKLFIGCYLFWRFSYDFGIGYLLRQQSNHNRLVNWAKKVPPNSVLSNILKAEIKSQMGSKFNIDEYPIEFNTWLIFRKFVDLILMSDFVNFIGLFIVCSLQNDFQAINFDQQPHWLVYLRLILGSVLILFNYWVKVNAHNTIKDYAWYWGDFFFRQINNEDLIFDGVFEMVPHPMYSVGYIGYYGFALIAKSYTVLILACVGHFLQMIFLHFIENPHIDKIYGPSANEIDHLKLNKLKDLKHFDNSKPLIGLLNLNILRGSDIVTLVLIVTYAAIVPFFATAKSLFYITVAIKVFESITINTLLLLQSKFKAFTKYYLLNDIPIENSLSNFAIIFNTFNSLTYAAIFGLNFFFYLNGVDTTDLFINDWRYLRMFLGGVLILVQISINFSIIDSIGYFGWFYGDFFIPRSAYRAHLTKAGVYRYLNNPEQIFGVCGIMGLFFILPNYQNLILTCIWVTNNFIRINFIEKAHMIQLYGEEEVLQDSGVTKTFKKHLIPDVLTKRRESNTLLNQQRRKDSVMSETIDQIVKEFKKSNKLSKQNVNELSQNLYFENSDYKIQITNLSYTEEDTKDLKYVEIGKPIHIELTIPEAHSERDWVGLYKIAQTSYSRYKTLISSNGRWKWATETSLTFDKDRLFYDEGVYEFRYHLDGKHDVVYISEPFEIKSPRLKVPSDTESIYSFAKTLKSEVIDKIVQIDDINASINQFVEKQDGILENYNRLSNLISLATGIKINNKIFLYSDNLSILALSSKLIHLKKVLDELSFEDRAKSS